MAFPSTNVVLLRDALDVVRQAAYAIKEGAQRLRALSLGSSTGASSILEFALLLAEQRALLDSHAATPGLGAYAQQQINDDEFDIVAAYSAMVAQIDATVTWIVSNFPKDANGYLLERQLASDGRTVERTFNSAALAGLRAQLDALIATID